MLEKFLKILLAENILLFKYKLEFVNEQFD